MFVLNFGRIVKSHVVQQSTLWVNLYNTSNPCLHASSWQELTSVAALSNFVQFSLPGRKFCCSKCHPWYSPPKTVVLPLRVIKTTENPVKGLGCRRHSVNVSRIELNHENLTLSFWIGISYENTPWTKSEHDFLPDHFLVMLFWGLWLSTCISRNDIYVALWF